MYVYAGIDEAGYGPMFGPLLVGRMVLGIPHLSADAPDAELRDYSGKQLWRRLSKAVCRDLTKRKGRIAVNDSKKLRTAKASGLGSGKATAALGGDREDDLDPEQNRADGRGSTGNADAAGRANGGGDRVPAAFSDESRALWLDGSYLKSIEHLERGVLAFAALAGHKSATVRDWLDCLGERCHHDLAHLPWYAPSDNRPWGTLPCACTDGEIAVARSLLATTAQKAGVQVLDLGAAVVFEDRFNKMVAATRSKAATSFTFVAGHLRAIWDGYGKHHPRVVVDRQSGRMHYRELLSMTFPEADLTILEETPDISGYRLEMKAPPSVRPSATRRMDAADRAGETKEPVSSGAGSDRQSNPSAASCPTLRAMTVSFEVDSEQQHMPVALASMVSKYTRELMMSRFQSWFLEHAPHVRPTAGYATDAKRFWEEIQPLLPGLAIEPGRLARMA
jgi:ribonuclease HII